MKMIRLQNTRAACAGNFPRCEVNCRPHRLHEPVAGEPVPGNTILPFMAGLMAVSGVCERVYGQTPDMFHRD